MPPQARLTKETILKAGLDLVREKGLEGLNARALASAMGCSTRPLYSIYTSMDQLKADLFGFANQYFGSFLQESVRKEAKTDNGFLKFGLAYIHFAEQEPNIFKMLFLTESIGAEGLGGMVSPADHGFVLESIRNGDAAMSEAAGQQYFLDMWVFTHGMAMLAAFGGMEVSDDEAIAMLTRMSKAVKALDQGGADHGNTNL